MRNIQSLLVVLFFGVMMTLLFQDHIIPSMKSGPGIDVDHRVLADGWANEDLWYTIKFAGTPIGAVRTTAEEAVDLDYSDFSITAHLELNNPFVRGRIMTAANLNHRLELTDFRARAQIAQAGQKVMSAEILDGEVLPKDAYEVAIRIDDGRDLKARLRHDGAIQYFSLRLDRAPTMTDTISPILRGNMLSKNVVYSMEVYEPLFDSLRGGKAGTVEIEYMNNYRMLFGSEYKMIREVELRLDGRKMILLVDNEGKIIRRTIPLLSTNDERIDENAALVMELQENVDRTNRYGNLEYVPTVPDLTKEKMEGEDVGQVFSGVSLFSLLGKGLAN